MGRKAFCVPALVTSFIACVLLLLCTISTPTTFHTSTPFEYVRATNIDNVTDVSRNANNARNVTGLKLGNWGYCTQTGGRGSYDYCSEPNDHEYNVTLRRADPNSQAAYGETSITKGWVRGLVAVVPAFVIAVIAFILSFIPHLMVMLVASIVHLIAFVITLVAFIIQIVLYIHTRVRIHDISPDASIVPGPAFYLTLISLPLLFFSALTVCCGWRKEKNEGSLPSSYSGGAGAYGGGSTFGSKFGNKLSFGRGSRNANASSTYAHDTTTSAPKEEYPMQTSRQRVLDAFQSDNKQ